MDPVIGLIKLLYVYSAENTLLVFGVASAVLSTIAFFPYIIDTIARRTRPHRASWLIWSVLGSIAFCSQVFEGASSSLWFAGVQVTGTIIVFVLSIRSGFGGYLSRSDYLILVAASVGLVLWYFTDNAAYALAITISISLLGGLATAVKAYNDPDSETLVTWVISLLASVCAVMSVGKLDPVLLAYPLYLLTLYSAFVIAIILGRARREFAGESASVPANRPLMSFGMVRRGLRTTADAVIVAAAMVYSFNWLGSTDNNVLNVASNAQPLASTINKAGLFDAFVTSAVAGTRDDLPQETDPAELKPGAVPELSLTGPESDALGAVTPTIIVVAMQSSEGVPLELKVLDQSDPLAIDVRNRVGGSLSTTLSKTRQKITRSVDLSGTFLPLDEDDPFARLVVKSDGAEIISMAADEPVRLLHGESIQALETNGEWILARSSGGIQGYVHRSMVAIEALASLSRSRALN